MTFDDIFKSSFLENVSSASILDMLLTIVLSFGIGLFIFLIYKKTYRGVMYSAGFGTTLVALTMITSIVILAVTSNVVLSLGMVGALSIVRFRAAIKDPLDIAFLFWAIGAGIILAAVMIPLAIIGSVCIGLILLVFVNKKPNTRPYMVVLSCVNHDAELKSIRCFVVHNYVCNGDSYTGSMVHNYYLYEENGQMTMIPWDYNLAFGTFQGGNAQSAVNTPIDVPVSGGSGEDRPMWHWILSDESYTELYHQYFTEFLNTVDIAGIIDNAYNLIKSYVEKDPMAFYTYEEFETGVEAIRQFCALRSESISMQLANGETANNMSYVDASALTLSDMGSMGAGGGFDGGMPGVSENKDDFGGRGSSDGTAPPKPDTDTNASSESNIQETPATPPESMPQNGEMPAMPEGSDPSQMQGGFDGQMPNMGEMPEGFDPSQMPGGFPNQPSDGTETSPSDNSGSTYSSGNSNRPSRGDMQLPNDDFNPDMNGMKNAASGSSGLIWLVVSILILGAGLIIAKLYKY